MYKNINYEIGLFNDQIDYRHPAYSLRILKYNDYKNFNFLHYCLRGQKFGEELFKYCNVYN